VTLRPERRSSGARETAIVKKPLVKVIVCTKAVTSHDSKRPAESGVSTRSGAMRIEHAIPRHSHQQKNDAFVDYVWKIEIQTSQPEKRVSRVDRDSTATQSSPILWLSAQMNAGPIIFCRCVAIKSLASEEAVRLRRWKPLKDNQSSKSE
jgi:hypothetical protein